jgi:chemotaxis signal transduction protein
MAMVSNSSDAIGDAQAVTEPVRARESRHILTQVGDQKLAFPPTWVLEVMRVEQAAILPLPFYSSAILGVVNHQGEIVPLIVAQSAVFKQTERPRRETLTAIRLSQTVGSLAGIALIVDQVIGSVSSQQVSAQRSEIRLFQPQDISGQIWQPRRWRSQV